MKKKIVLVLLATSMLSLSGCSLLTNIISKINSEEQSSNIESSESSESYSSEPAEVKELTIYGEYIVTDEDGRGAQLSFAGCDAYCEDAPVVKLAGDLVHIRYTGELNVLYWYPSTYDIEGVVEATYTKARYISLYSEGGFNVEELRGQYNFADDKVMMTCDKNTGFVYLDDYEGDTLYLTLKPDEHLSDNQEPELRTVMGLYANRPSRPANI